MFTVTDIVFGRKSCFKEYNGLQATWMLLYGYHLTKTKIIFVKECCYVRVLIPVSSIVLVENQ